MQLTNITSKETYIAWRAEWRAEYSEQTKLIRSLRRQMNEAFREGRDAARLQYQLRNARYKAYEMMVEREQAKQICAEQYAAAKAAKQAA